MLGTVEHPAGAVGARSEAGCLPGQASAFGMRQRQPARPGDDTRQPGLSLGFGAGQRQQAAELKLTDEDLTDRLKLSADSDEAGAL